MCFTTEVAFYNDIAHKAHLPSPTCFFAGTDYDREDGTKRAIILMENLFSRPGQKLETRTHLDGYPLQVAKRAVISLARFHSQFWDQPQRKLDGELKAFNVESIDSGCIPLFDWRILDKLEKGPVEFIEYGMTDHPLITDGERASAELFSSWQPKIRKNARYILKKTAAMPRTLAHMDAHVENAFWDDNSLVFIDFQLCQYGPAVWDLAYGVLGFSDLLSCEEEIVRTYYNELVICGIDAYSDFEQCFADYQFCKWSVYIIFLYQGPSWLNMLQSKQGAFGVNPTEEERNVKKNIEALFTRMGAGFLGASDWIKQLEL